MQSAQVRPASSAVLAKAPVPLVHTVRLYRNQQRASSIFGRRPSAVSATVLTSPLTGVSATAPSFFYRPAALDIPRPTPGFDPIPEALRAIAAGELVVVLDNEHRENEGDLIGAADRISTEATAFLARHTSGVVCVGMRGEDLDRLRLPLMVESTENEETMYTSFTVTVDAREGVTTGISAQERAHTLRTLSEPSTRPENLRRPGHIFPLRGGVLTRPGHTEAGADLAELAGCFPAGALAEVVNDDAQGTMARTPELKDFARDHQLKIITIDDLIRYRCHTERLVEPAAPDAELDQWADVHGVHVTAFASQVDGAEVLLMSGMRIRTTPPLLQVLRVSRSSYEQQQLIEEAAQFDGVSVILTTDHDEQAGVNYVQDALVAQTLKGCGIEQVCLVGNTVSGAVLQSFGIAVVEGKQ